MRLKWREEVEHLSQIWSDEFASAELARVLGGTPSPPGAGGPSLGGGPVVSGGGGPGLGQVIVQSVIGALAYDFVKSEAEGFVDGMQIGLDAIGEWLTAEAPVETVPDISPPPMDAGIPAGVEQQHHEPMEPSLGSGRTNLEFWY
jgi:hypothetical protein